MATLPLGLYAAIAERQSWKPRTLPILKNSGAVGSLLWPDDNKTLLASYENKLCLWDVAKKSLRHSVNTGSPIYNR